MPLSEEYFEFLGKKIGFLVNFQVTINLPRQTKYMEVSFGNLYNLDLQINDFHKFWTLFY